jgi:hypothetical protein
MYLGLLLVHREHRTSNKDCQMVYFHTKNPKLDIFWRALEWKKLVLAILWPSDIFYRHFDIFYGKLHRIYFMVNYIEYILWSFGIF